MRRVEQQEYYGCGIACLAMITDQTYEQVRAHFTDKRFETGAGELDMQNYLVEHAYAVAMKYPFYSPHGEYRKDWPPKPFAPIHFVAVSTPAGFHSVVMLHDGAIIDPSPHMPGLYTLADYQKVMHVGGVCRMSINQFQKRGTIP